MLSKDGSLRILLSWTTKGFREFQHAAATSTNTAKDQFVISALITSSNPYLCGNVNPNYWRFSGRENVDGQIHALGGPCLQDELRKVRTTTTGDLLETCVVSTASHQWKELAGVDRILHVHVPDGVYGNVQEEKYELTMRNILNLANQEHISYLVLPALGCGVKGWHPAVAARITFSLLIQERQQLCSKLTDLHFLFTDKRAYRAYETMGEKLLIHPQQPSSQTKCSENHRVFCL